MSSLSHVHIVTIALNVPGPVAAAYLRDLGATILKVEPPTGDPLLSICPGWYDELHRGIQVERLDLKRPVDRERMGGALDHAHLLLSSQRPSALVRLGLDAATLAAAPRTAHVRTLNIVGELARPEVAGHDLTYLARAGLLGRDLPRTLVADVLGAARAAAVAQTLLHQAPGARATVGLFDSLDPLIAARRHGLTSEGAVLGGGLPAYGIYPTRDGHLAVAALEPHFQSRLYRALDLPEGSALTRAFLHRTGAEWEAWAAAHDLPISVVGP